jgi:hypothetical protein
MSSVAKAANRIPPALKHGLYSGLGRLPTEDRAEYEKFVREIVDEYAPSGRSEVDIVSNMAQLMWRRQNIQTYLIAKCAKALSESIHIRLGPGEVGPQLVWPKIGEWKEDTRSSEEIEVMRKAARDEAKSQLGETQELVRLGDVTTTEFLLEHLSVVERLDGMIDRYIKRLLMVRGVKSMSVSSIEDKTETRLKKIG